MSQHIPATGPTPFTCPRCERPLRHHKPGVHQHGTNIWSCDHCGARYTNEMLEDLEKEKMTCFAPDVKPEQKEETSPKTVEESGMFVKNAKLQSQEKEVKKNASRPKTHTLD